MLYPCPYLAVTADREKQKKTIQQQRNSREPREKVDQTSEDSDEELEIEAITIETARELQNEDEQLDEIPDVRTSDESERTVEEPVAQVAEENL